MALQICHEAHSVALAKNLGQPIIRDRSIFSLIDIKSFSYEFTHLIESLRGFGRPTLRHLAQNIECGDPVRFGIGRKVEDVVDKRFDRCAALKG